MSLRTDRVASLIKEEVGSWFAANYRDTDAGFLTVMEVHMTPDLRIAKIYVSIFGSDAVKQRTMRILEDDKPQIRAWLGSHLRLKFTPSLQFYIDETLDRVQRINDLIRQAQKKDGGEGR